MEQILCMYRSKYTLNILYICIVYVSVSSCVQPVFRQHDSNANFGKITDGSLASVVRVPDWYGLLPCVRTASESGLVPSQL